MAYNSMCICLHILNSTVYHISIYLVVFVSIHLKQGNNNGFKTSNTHGMYTPEMPGFTPRNRETCILHHTGQSKRGKPEQLSWFSQVGPQESNVGTYNSIKKGVVTPVKPDLIQSFIGFIISHFITAKGPPCSDTLVGFFCEAIRHPKNAAPTAGFQHLAVKVICWML